MLPFSLCNAHVNISICSMRSINSILLKWKEEKVGKSCVLFPPVSEQSLLQMEEKNNGKKHSVLYIPLTNRVRGPY